MCMCACVCMCACACKHMCACVCMCACAGICICVCMCVHVCLHVFVCARARVSVCTWACVHVCTRSCVLVCACVLRTCACVCVYVCACACVSVCMCTCERVCGEQLVTVLGLADRTIPARPSEALSPWMRPSRGCWGWVSVLGVKVTHTPAAHVQPLARGTGCSAAPGFGVPVCGQWPQGDKLPLCRRWSCDSPRHSPLQMGLIKLLANERV